MPVRGKSSSWFCVPTNVQSAKSISILERSSMYLKNVSVVLFRQYATRRDPRTNARMGTAGWIVTGPSSADGCFSIAAGFFYSG